MNQKYDAIIIGTGQAGPPLPKRLSDAGMSVAIVERHLFGGTCVNTGCIPTKAMVASAYAAHLTRRARDLVDNALNRYALGDWSHCTRGSDGSLTIYIQSESPSADQESNWLPAPKTGTFKLALRLYVPKKTE